MKMVVVHPALMDYRLDFFTNLNKIYDITFIFTRQGRGQDDVTEKHLKIPSEWDYRIVRSDKMTVRGRSIVMYLKLMRDLLRRKYGIVLASTSWYVCFPISKITGKKFIFLTEYWHFASNSFSERLLNLLTKFIAKHADAIIATGTKSYKAHLSMGVKSEKIFKCVQCAIDYSKLPIRDLKNEPGLEGKKIILYLSRIVPHKGLDYLIKAFALLEKETEVALLIVGDGPFRRECEKLVEELGIKNIYFIGGVFDDMIKASYYNVCDVFVLPAIFDIQYEAWGLVLNEALAFGKPIVTTDAVGAAYDLVKDDYNGYVVKNRNITKLYERLHVILSNTELARAMGKNSRKMFEEKNNYGEMAKAFAEAIDYVSCR